MGISKKNIFYIILLFLYFLFLYTEYGNVVFEAKWKQDEGTIEVYFCPQDDCKQVHLDLIEQANDISCAFYELKVESIANALQEKQARVVLHDEELHKGGLMHNKFCIFDEKIVLTGSTNPTENGFTKNDNNVVVIESKFLAQNYLAEFEELMGHLESMPPYPKINLSGILVQNYFCPEDNCEEKILHTLAQAKEEIVFMTFSFTSDSIGNLLIQKHSQGINVQGIMERRMKNQWWEYDKLKQVGINVTLDTNPNTMHHKVFIIDEEIVITGSMNPTNNGNKNNDENIIIIKNKQIAKKFLLAHNMTKNRFSNT